MAMKVACLRESDMGSDATEAASNELSTPQPLQTFRLALRAKWAIDAHSEPHCECAHDGRSYGCTITRRCANTTCAVPQLAPVTIVFAGPTEEPASPQLWLLVGAVSDRTKALKIVAFCTRTHMCCRVRCSTHRTQVSGTSTRTVYNLCSQHKAA